MDKKEIKRYVYSIRINSKQRKLLKDNPNLKIELDKIVLQYLNAYL